MPETELLIDRVVAPIMYRILFRPGPLDAAYARALVTNAVYAPQIEAGARPTQAAAPRRSKKPDS